MANHVNAKYELHISATKQILHVERDVPILVFIN